MSEHGFPGGIPLLGAGWLRVTELYAMPTDGCGHRLAWLSLTPIAVRSGRINRSRFGSVLPQTIKDFAGLISYIRPKLLGDSGPHLFAATGDRSFIDGSLLPASERSRRMLRRSSTRISALVIYIPCRSPEMVSPASIASIHYFIRREWQDDTCPSLFLLPMDLDEEAASSQRIEPILLGLGVSSPRLAGFLRKGNRHSRESHGEG